jgi:hypothetical protein
MNITQPGVGFGVTDIWSAPNRTLTGFGSAFEPSGAEALSLSAGSIAVFKTNDGTMGFIEVVGLAGAGVAWATGISDGTTLSIGVIGSSAQPLHALGLFNSLTGFALANIGTSSGLYSFTEILIRP